MKKLLFILMLLPIIAKTQVGYESLYSEIDLQSNLKNAKTIDQQLDATGSLAVYYKKIFKDSLGSVYLKKVFAIAENSKNVLLMARALWWDIYYESSTENLNKYLEYAEKHNLVRERIFAYFCLIDFHIHQELSVADKHCITAQSLLDNWKKDTTGKDSVRLEAYRRFTHTYIHIKNGIKASQYLQALQEYALHHADETLRMQAVNVLGDMYFEWLGQEKKAFPWLEKEYEYLKRTNQPHVLLGNLFFLAVLHGRLENKKEAKSYFTEFEKLQDSLKAYGSYQIYILDNKMYLELISPEEYIKTLDGNFNNTLFLPPKNRATNKAEFYLMQQQWDSVKVYLSLAKKLGEDNRRHWVEYYSQKKDYENLIPLLKELIKENEKKGDLNNVQWMSKDLALIYKDKKDYKTAFEYLNKSRIFKDSLQRLRSEQTVAGMEMQKQIEIQKTTFEEQKKIQESEQARLALKNKVRFLGLLGGIAILLLIAGILLRNNRRKQKDKLKIEQAYQELQSTQQQLIQSEKMASLGELTAGIAHEIQNPLNFVNNFSDVNRELADELEQEIDKGNYIDAKAIAKDIKDNEQKINHHGKRADAIVKGMLQHSRTSSGQKEPTDINALCDEYLRLAYHGLRAKDKSFNATMKTDFDNNIGKINIIPQDVGRVILNLINNAFYAAPLPPEGGFKNTQHKHEPTVWVSTKKVGDKVLISVKDNGPGIPQKILEKIFQPFFTTKPTGQGTGLGLSLSYDIVKAHGGELKVETKEGQGSEFIIQLPVN